MDAIGGLLSVLAALAVYLIPGWVAVIRRHHQSAAIMVLTLLLGWTGIGWVVALVWACTAVRGVGDRPHPGRQA